MRRADRAITAEEASAILSAGEYGVLSTVSESGEPYGVPVSYCVIDQYIYFHCAVVGQKISNIKTNNSVSFCTVGKTEILPGKFSTKFESVIVSGDAEEVFDNEWQIGLEGLLFKYSPDYVEKGKEYIENLKDRTKVYRISIISMTGKARR